MSEWHKALQEHRQKLLADLQDAVRNRADADRIVAITTELNALNSAYDAKRFMADEEPVDRQGHFEENKAERYEKNFATVLGQRHRSLHDALVQSGAGGIHVKADSVSRIRKLMDEVKTLAMNSGPLPPNADAASFFNAVNTAELWAIKLATA